MHRIARFLGPHMRALHNVRAAVCAVAVVLVLAVPSLFLRHRLRMAHAAIYAAVILRLFLIRYPVFLVADDYALTTNLQPIEALKHDAQQWWSAVADQLILVIAAMALALAALCSLCLLYSRSLILWRTGLLCLSAAWLREEPLIDAVASKPRVAIALSRAHDQLLDAAVLVR